MNRTKHTDLRKDASAIARRFRQVVRPEVLATMTLGLALMFWAAHLSNAALGSI